MRRCGAASCSQSAEGRERAAHVAKFVANDETSPQRLPRGLMKQLRRDARLRAVDQRTARGRDWDCAKPGLVLRRHVGVMQDDARWRAEAATVPGERQRQVN